MTEKTANADYYKSAAGRRHSWFGRKTATKRFLGWRIPHAALRTALRFVPDAKRNPRLPAPSHTREVRGSVGEEFFWMLDPSRCVVAKELYWGHGRRPGPADNFAIEIFGSLAKVADVVFDIGAYTGIFSLVSCVMNPGVEVHAFEIVPDVLETLFRNCVRNDVLERVTLHPRGVGDPAHVMVAPVHTRGSALPDFFSSSTHFSGGVHIPFVALDDLRPMVAAGKDRVLIKIDVEGTEGALFEHGARFIEEFRPTILCEILPNAATTAQIGALLSRCGYQLHVVGEGVLEHREVLAPDERFRDWLFVPGRLAGTE